MERAAAPGSSDNNKRIVPRVQQSFLPQSLPQLHQCPTSVVSPRPLSEKYLPILFGGPVAMPKCHCCASQLFLAACPSAKRRRERNMFIYCLTSAHPRPGRHSTSSRPTPAAQRGHIGWTFTGGAGASIDVVDRHGYSLCCGKLLLPAAMPPPSTTRVCPFT